MSNTISRSDWADYYIRIDGRPIDWGRYPWVLAPLDSSAKRIAVKKGAQIGFSVMLVVRALYDCLQAGKNVMIVEPTQKDASDFQTRVVAIIDDVAESVRGQFHAREGLIRFKDKGTSLYIRSSGGRTSLRSVPVDTLLVDEVSAIHALKLSQALSRIDASKDKTAIFVSTPDWPGKGISILYLDGDQRTWQVECHHCNTRSALRFEDFQLYEEAPERSFLRCPTCQTPRPEDKTKWKCHWVATSEAPAGSESYHISQLASHTVSNRELADKAIQAHRHVDLLKNWTNETLGLDWLPQDANRLQVFHVRACIRPYANATLYPRDGATCHVMGLDQGIRNHFVIARIDWPLGSNRHPIDAALATVVAVGTTKESDWEAVRQLQRDWGVWVTVCDRAGSSKILAQEFARSNRAPTWLAQYVETADISEFRESDAASYPLCLVNRTWALSAYQQRFKQRKIALPSDLDDAWLQQIVNTTLDTSGRRFIQLGDDHIAHAMAYTEIGIRLVVKHFGGSIGWTRRTA
jgi:phage terminase large subunit GpA-like protein